MSTSDSLSLSRRSRRLVVSVLTAVLTATGVVAVNEARAAAALDPPTDVRAIAFTSTSVTFSWTAPAGDIVSYRIAAMQTYNDVAGPSAEVGPGTTGTLSGMHPTGEYRIWVSAIDREGNRSSSSPILVATPAVDTGPDTTIPSTPTGLRATSLTPSGVTLVWDPSTDNVGVTGYDVFKYDGMFYASRVATVTGTTYSGSPATGSGQFFFVRARDAAGNLSLTSNTAGNASGLPPSTSPPPPTPTCRVTYRVTSEWGNGFVATLTIANTGTSAINDWTLTYAYGGGQKIISSWAGTVSQSGSAVTVKPVHWTRTIAAGGRVDVGILGTRTTANPPPAAFTLNGAPCSI